MKCTKCEFEYCESNEYGTEYYCAVFGDDVPEEFETNGGCNLRYNEAKKFCELNDKCIEKYHGSMYALYELSNRKPTKELQAEIDRIEKEYSLASKKLHNYYDVLVNRTDLKFKLLEYCSRECTFVERYSQEWRNRRYQDDILLRINKCLGTNFTREEMELVYDVLGNGCNHKLAKRFVSSGYDMKLLERKENE